MPIQCTDFKHNGCWIKPMLAYLLVRSVELEEEKQQTGSSHHLLCCVSARKPWWEDQSASSLSLDALIPQDNTFNFKCKPIVSLACNIPLNRTYPGGNFTCHRFLKTTCLFSPKCVLQENNICTYTFIFMNLKKRSLLGQK